MHIRIPLVQDILGAPLHLVLLPISLCLQDGVDTNHRDVHTHADKDEELTHRTQVVQENMLVCACSTLWQMDVSVLHT